MEWLQVAVIVLSFIAVLFVRDHISGDEEDSEGVVKEIKGGVLEVSGCDLIGMKDEGEQKVYYFRRV